MRGSLIETDDILGATGCVNPGDAMRVLREQGIHVFYGKKGFIFTTIDIVNAAGGIKKAGNQAYQVDEVL